VEIKYFHKNTTILWILVLLHIFFAKAVSNKKKQLLHEVKDAFLNFFQYKSEKLLA
jgi:hypothetical protein